jgi:hypothetical protein
MIRFYYFGYYNNTAFKTNCSFKFHVNFPLSLFKKNSFFYTFSGCFMVFSNLANESEILINYPNELFWKIFRI